MKNHVNQKLVVLMLFVCLITMPTAWPWDDGPVATVYADRRNGQPADPCKAVKMWKFMFATTAFLLAPTPFVAVSLTYGVLALAAEGYDAIYCP